MFSTNGSNSVFNEFHSFKKAKVCQIIFVSMKNVFVRCDHDDDDPDRQRRWVLYLLYALTFH